MHGIWMERPSTCWRAISITRSSDYLAKDSLKLIESPGDTEELGRGSQPGRHHLSDTWFYRTGSTFTVDSRAVGMYYGMTRLTGKAELVKAGLESIATRLQM